MNPQEIIETMLQGIRALLNQKSKPLSPISEGYQIPSQTPPTLPPRFDRLSYYLPTGNQTATGTTPTSGYTAAISRELRGKIPMGTLLKLPNGQVVRVEDLTSRDIQDTLDLFYSSPEQAKYPKKGLMRNVPYNVVGRNTEGLRYNY